MASGSVNYSGVNTSLTATKYENLMLKRISKVLLICSSYDAFTLEEDGRIDSHMTREFLDLNLTTPPSFTRVSSAKEAISILDASSDYDLIISMTNIGELDVFKFSGIIKKKYGNIPFVLLTSFSREISLRLQSEDLTHIDYVFSWLGSTDLILAIIKLIEDKMNVDNDVKQVGVQTIILVEDSIKYYSAYLPVIYRMLLEQSSEFLKEALNEQQQMLHRRARPKILLATTYDEAVALYEKYKNHLLGVISDVSFKKDKLCSEIKDSGVDLAMYIKKDNPLMPIILQSSDESKREKAESLGVGFINKYSNTLLLELSGYIGREFFFGDFIFRDPKTGEEVAVAKDLNQMHEALSEVSDEVLLHHAESNHLSKWMFARGLFALAEIVKRANKGQFHSVDEFRQYLVKAVGDYRSFLGQGVIARFNPVTYNEYIWFARMGDGSMGGKARGLAFINSMLQNHRLYDRYPGVRITIPRTIVISTEFFDEFIMENGLQYVINSDAADDEIISEFVSARLPERLTVKLRAFMKTVKSPIAVRSSSKLEDSHFQPFAGVYSTYMIPYTNNSEQTLRFLGKAIKSVYASVYFSSSRAYIMASSNVLAEEKMGVVIQEVCGTEDSGYFFPTVSGVARSINCYPIGDEKPSDGVANIALGLGKLVVDGGQSLRFSPKHSKKILQLSTPELALKESQRYMYALDLSPEAFKTSVDDSVNIRKIEIARASEFRNMKHVSSTWDAQNNTISDSVFDKGRKIVTFANILKYDSFPLAEILSDLLRIGEEELKAPIEIEFAVNMDVPYNHEKPFQLLQIRPMVETHQRQQIDWSNIKRDNEIIYCESALGLGYIENLHDIIYVREENFNPADTELMAQQINDINIEMQKQGHNYILIGPGRWGSSDPWLGIPVKWSQISQARVIVESGMENFRVDPSQGTHFFQNLTSFGAGYMTLNPYLNEGVYNRETLNNWPATSETEYFRHVHFDKPLTVVVDGTNNKGIITFEK